VIDGLALAGPINPVNVKTANIESIIVAITTNPLFFTSTLSFMYTV
jgi:hypothetical protein